MAQPILLSTCILCGQSLMNADTRCARCARPAPGQRRLSAASFPQRRHRPARPTPLNQPITDDSGEPDPTEPVQQYGAIPWRRTRGGKLKVLLVTSRNSRRWILPKGWPIAGRSPAEVAAQEAFEEAGVFGDVTNDPILSYAVDQTAANGSVEDRLITLFPLRVRATLIDWPEKHERQRRWMKLPEAAQAVNDPELAQSIARIELVEHVALAAAI